MGSGGNSVRPRHRRIVRLTEPATVGGLPHGGAYPALFGSISRAGEFERSKSCKVISGVRAIGHIVILSDFGWAIVDCGGNFCPGVAQLRHLDH